MNTTKKISIVYDRVINNFVVPNIIPFDKIIPLLYTFDEFTNNDFIQNYIKYYGEQPKYTNYFLGTPVYKYEIKSTFQIWEDFKSGINEPFLYLIESFGKFCLSLGYEKEEELEELMKTENRMEIENSFFKNIDEKILMLANDTKGYIVFNCFHEGHISDLDVKFLEELLIKYKIPKEKFILIYNSFKTIYTPFPSYNYDTHLAKKSVETFELNEMNKLNKNNIFKKENTFHIPIRRLREHRVQLLEKLFEYDNDFIKKNLISYDVGLENNLQCLELYSKNINFKNHILETKKKNIDDYDIGELSGYGYENKNVYEKSYFTIVCEAYFKENWNYISEKTYKPIAHQHPFLVLGRPYTLRYLRKIGFKTFSPFIDESYDFEPNDEKRLNMIILEMKKLNSLSQKELDEMIQSLNPILQYNYEYLININKDKKLEKIFVDFIKQSVLK